MVTIPELPGPGCFLKKQAEPTPRGQRTMLSTRPPT